MYYILSVSTKFVARILTGIAMNLKIKLKQSCTLKIVGIPVHKHELCLYLKILPDLFCQCFSFFSPHRPVYILLGLKLRGRRDELIL